MVRDPEGQDEHGLLLELGRKRPTESQAPDENDCAWAYKHLHSNAEGCIHEYEAHILTTSWGERGRDASVGQGGQMADGEYGCQCGGEREAVKANLPKGTHLERNTKVQDESK